MRYITHMKISQFLRRVNAIGERSGDGCWEWDGTRTLGGYGRAYVEGPNRSVHRYVVEILYGPVARHLDVCHRCDNPCCCNPDHLFVGTRSENMRDCVAKGRFTNYRANQTHCKRGHPLSGPNLRVYDKKRVCVECRRRCSAAHEITRPKRDWSALIARRREARKHQS